MKDGKGLRPRAALSVTGDEGHAQVAEGLVPGRWCRTGGTGRVLAAERARLEVLGWIGWSP